jgi:hypothetical protein
MENQCLIRRSIERRLPQTIRTISKGDNLNSTPNPAAPRNPPTRTALCYVFPFLLFSALNFAHRALVAFEIFALAAADITCFLT